MGHVRYGAILIEYKFEFSWCLPRHVVAWDLKSLGAVLSGSWLNSRVSRVPLPFTGFCIQKLFVSAKHVNKTTDL